MKKILLIIALIFTALPVFAADNNADKSESVYERVMQTNTLRCGYWSWEPLYIVDTNTGKSSGIFKDVMNEFERVSGIKVEWISEVSFGGFMNDLNSGKVDAVCAGVWPSFIDAKYIRFSEPIFFIPLNIYKRADDTRFDFSVESINNPDVSFAVMDGEMSSQIRDSDFPLSKQFAIPQIAGAGTELLLNVSNKKADVTVTDAVNGAQFIKANPKKIQIVKLEMPIRIMPNTIAVAGDEERLQTFLNVNIQQLHNSGIIEKILRNYDKTYPDTLIRVAKPYAGTK